MGFTKKQAKELLEAGYLDQAAYDKMFADGVVKESTRATRPQINVPNEHREVFQDKAYEAMEAIAKELGFDYSVATPDSGLATLYLKGAGKPRAEKTEGEDEADLTSEETEG